MATADRSESDDFHPSKIMEPAPNALFPCARTGVAFHRRLCDGDPIVAIAFVREYHTPLLACILRTNPGVDPDISETAVHEALLDVIKNPHRFDPQRGDLAAYLRMSAQRDLQNGLRNEARHHRGRRDWESVELSLAAGNLLRQSDDPSLPLQAAETPGHPVLSAVREILSDEERQVLDLMLSGERRTQAFARVLGLADAAGAVQKAQVKRVKDRIRQRLRRAGGGRAT